MKKTVLYSLLVSFLFSSNLKADETSQKAPYEVSKPASNGLSPAKKKQRQNIIIAACASTVAIITLILVAKQS